MAGAGAKGVPRSRKGRMCVFRSGEAFAARMRRLSTLLIESALQPHPTVYVHVEMCGSRTGEIAHGPAVSDHVKDHLLQAFVPATPHRLAVHERTSITCTH